MQHRLHYKMNEWLDEELFRFERYVLSRKHKLFSAERGLLQLERTLMMSTASNSSPVDNRSYHRFTLRDIAEMLPECNPLDEKSSTAKNFIKRIRDLNAVYVWDNKLLLFAAQSKLRGYAKNSNDSSAVRYEKFDDFASDLMRDFPSRIDEADVHIEMLNTKR